MKAHIFIGVFLTISFADLDAQIIEKVTNFSAEFPSAEYTVYHSKFYFDADDGVHGFQFWESDGTSLGTKMLKDLDSSFGGEGSPTGFTVYNDKLYFKASDGIHGFELWVSDGTYAGTQMLKDINTQGSASPYQMTISNNKLYFGASDNLNDGTNYELWSTDGTPQGTQKVKDINSKGGSGPQVLKAFKDKLFFNAHDDTHNTEPWISDGTPTGTKLLKDIFHGAPGSYPSEYTVFNDQVFFIATDSTGQQVWATDGTETGTRVISDLPFRTNLGYLTVLNNKLYFQSTETNDTIGGSTIWVTDGTTAGTKLIKRICPFPYADARMSSFTLYHNKLYFRAAQDTSSADQLWVCDGTENGTTIVKFIDDPHEDSYPHNFVVFHDKLYFIAADGVNGRELWVTDGTKDGTKKISPANPARNPLNLTTEFAELNGALYFSAAYDNFGYQIWRLRDTSSLTVRHTDPANNTAIYPYLAHSLLHIEISQPANITISNLLGSTVRKESIHSAGAIDVSGLKNGIYFIWDENNSFNAKFIKE